MDTETNTPETEEETSAAEAKAVPVPPSHPKRLGLVVPVLLPIAAVLVTALMAINISRVFLASSKHLAVVIASVITIAILVTAATLSYAQRIRTSSMAVFCLGIIGLAVVAGSSTLGAADKKGEEAKAAGYKQPPGAPVQTLEVDALPSLHFQSTNFTVAPGVTRIVYVSKGGTHTLVFDKGVPGFGLQVDGAGDSDQSKAALKAGQTYTVYCTIQGHRAAGMQATVTVDPNAAPIAPPNAAPSG